MYCRLESCLDLAWGKYFLLRLFFPVHTIVLLLRVHTFTINTVLGFSVLRISDILVRIRGSVPLTNGSDPDPDPSIFVSDLQDCNKNYVFANFGCILLFEAKFASFFKDKKS
jgi:hypothetical protein